MDARKNFAVDIAALAVYAVAANPAVTGIGLHEWIGLGLVLVFLVHGAVHVDWIIETVRSARRAPLQSRVMNMALDAAIVVAFMVCIVSGLLVSGAVLPAFGWYATGYYFWDPLHAISAKVLLALLLVHVVAHGKWLVNVVRLGKGEQHGEQG